MTTQEYSEKIEILEKEKRELNAIIDALKREYLSHAPFKSGDKVFVKAEFSERFAFVNYVEIDRYTKEYEYRFDEVKKDGTRSMRRDYISGIKEITLAPKW